ncbi:Fur family transcriptional regulator [Kocuria palustris]|uniref:Fur family transcriptional regulator n=1 Tax=Kocuria palustris TaxID=71999 RepID=UPI00077B735C|nr:Fur family transcriptional regulator [Kocuria palustris]
MSTPSAQQPHAAVRVTRQRRAVQAAMSAQSDFISTQDLHAALRESGESVSLPTTYRILQSMAEAGEVDVLRSEDGESIYRQCAAEQHHHHLVCRRCGATVELQALEIERWTSQTAQDHGFTQVDHTVEIVGLCARCSAQAPAEDSSDDEGDDAPGAA